LQFKKKTLYCAAFVVIFDTLSFATGQSTAPHARGLVTLCKTANSIIIIIIIIIIVLFAQ